MSSYNPAIQIHYTNHLQYLGVLEEVRDDFEKSLGEFYARYGVDEVRYQWSEDGSVCFASPQVFKSVIVTREVS